jgi:hypothetical protein
VYGGGGWVGRCVCARETDREKVTERGIQRCQKTKAGEKGRGNKGAARAR